MFASLSKSMAIRLMLMEIHWFQNVRKMTSITIIHLLKLKLFSKPYMQILMVSKISLLHTGMLSLRSTLTMNTSSALTLLMSLSRVTTSKILFSSFLMSLTNSSSPHFTRIFSSSTRRMIQQHPHSIKISCSLNQECMVTCFHSERRALLRHLALQLHLVVRKALMLMCLTNIPIAVNLLQICAQRVNHLHQEWASAFHGMRRELVLDLKMLKILVFRSLFLNSVLALTLMYVLKKSSLLQKQLTST